MSEYKRLTKRVNGIAAKIKTSTSDYVGTIYEEEQVLQQEIIERLAELEDKLEAGTLVELPCKVGDTVYQTDGIRVYSSIVKNIVFDTVGVSFDKTAIGKSVFLTREAAEARLKELEEEGK